MGVEIREFDRLRDKVEIRLDSRQIGWLVMGCLAIASGVFAAGFHVGEANAQALPPSRTPSVLAASTNDAPAPSIQDARSSAPLHYTYDRVLADPTPPAKIDDPVLRAKAREILARQIASGTVDQEDLPARANTALEPGELLAGSPPTHDPATEKVEEAAPVADELEPRPVKAAAPAGVRVGAPRVPKAASAGVVPAGEAAKSGKGEKHRYTIQVKAFRKRKEARQFLNALREAGYHPYLMTADIPGKGRFYRVRLGRFDKLEEAESRQNAFEKAEGFKTILQTM